MSTELIARLLDLAGLLVLVASFVAVARSNRKLSISMRLNNMQAMVSEMNELRRIRAADPELERSLFDSRQNWTDEQISQNLVAVQLANIFEWAYLARRDGLIEKDVWESWVETWRSVILSSKPLQEAFTPSVWTFGRQKDVADALNELVRGASNIPDPHKGSSKFLGWLTGA